MTFGSIFVKGDSGFHAIFAFAINMQLMANLGKIKLCKKCWKKWKDTFWTLFQEFVRLQLNYTSLGVVI